MARGGPRTVERRALERKQTREAAEAAAKERDVVEWGKGEPVEAWQDRMLREQGIEVAMPKQNDRADAWLAAVKRYTDLTRQETRSAADEIELRTLYARYTPAPPPKLPSSYEVTVERLLAVKRRLDDPRTSDTVFNRLSWNFADLLNHLASNIEAGNWVGDARLKDMLAPPVDGAHQRVTGVDTVDT